MTCVQLRGCSLTPRLYLIARMIAAPGGHTSYADRRLRPTLHSLLPSFHPPPNPHQITIPSMLVFVAAFHPQLFINLLIALARCPGKMCRNRKAIFYGLFCCPCLFMRELWKLMQGVNARTKRARAATKARQHEMRVRLAVAVLCHHPAWPKRLRYRRPAWLVWLVPLKCTP